MEDEGARIRRACGGKHFGQRPDLVRRASTISSPTAAVDKAQETAWRPAPGVAPGQWIEFRLDSPVTRPELTILTQGAPTRLKVSTSLQGKTVASTTATAKRGEETKVTGLLARLTRSA